MIICLIPLVGISSVLFLTKMGNVQSTDVEYSVYHLDLSLNEKRLVRAAVKAYHTTGTYLSLKLFKRDSEQVDWDFNHKITLSAREFRLLCQNIEKLEQMIGQPVGLIDAVLKPDSADESKRPVKRASKTSTRHQKKIPKISVTANEDSEQILLYLWNSLPVIVYAFIVISLAFSFFFVMVETMYERSPDYFKIFQKRFRYHICETEPKLENTAIEIYAYGYHSSATVFEGCTFSSNHYHVMYEFGS